MSLVALVLGAVGVAMAMRAHLAQRLDTIAIMKSLGARSAQIMKIYLLQTLLLGVCRRILGVLFGLGVQLAFPLVLGKLINVPTELHIQPRPILAGLGAGILTTLLFTLPPLLDIRNVKPSLILRRDTENDVEPSREKPGIRKQPRPSPDRVSRRRDRSLYIAFSASPLALPHARADS